MRCSGSLRFLFSVHRSCHRRQLLDVFDKCLQISVVIPVVLHSSFKRDIVQQLWVLLRSCRRFIPNGEGIRPPLETFPYLVSSSKIDVVPVLIEIHKDSRRSLPASS